MICFSVRLTREDWDSGISGWRCDVLRLPGLVVDKIYIEGKELDQTQYHINTDHAHLRLNRQTIPTSASLMVSVPKNLTLGDEAEKWKRRAVSLPALATIVSGVVGALATLYASEYIGNSHASTPIVIPGHQYVAPSPISGTADVNQEMLSNAQKLFSISGPSAISEWSTSTCDDQGSLNSVSVVGRDVKWQINNDVDIEDLVSAANNKASTETIFSKHTSISDYPVGTKWTYVRTNDAINVTKDGQPYGRVVHCQ